MLTSAATDVPALAGLQGENFIDIQEEDDDQLLGRATQPPAPAAVLASLSAGVDGDSGGDSELAGSDAVYGDEEEEAEGGAVGEEDDAAFEALMARMEVCRG